jgi:hypothetical protein
MPSASFLIEAKISTILAEFKATYDVTVAYKFAQISLYDSSSLLSSKKVSYKGKPSLVELIDEFFVSDKKQDVPVKIKVQSVKKESVHVVVESGVLR